MIHDFMNFLTIHKSPCICNQFAPDQINDSTHCSTLTHLLVSFIDPYVIDTRCVYQDEHIEMDYT
jgi:hypothetical protein